MAKIEAEETTAFIHDSDYCDDNIANIGFLDSKGKSVRIDDNSNRPSDVSFFTLHSTIRPHFVDLKAPDIILISLCAYLALLPFPQRPFQLIL